MTNDAVLAILALPDIPERQLRFLLALGTFARGQHGWRKAGTKLLAAKARLSPTTAAKARGELVKAGTVEFVRGKGHGLSAYRIRLPAIADHESTNDAGDQPSTNDAGDQPSTNNAGDQPSTNNAGDQPPAVEYQPDRRRVPTGPSLSTRPDAAASGNANEGSSTFGSKSSGHSRPRLNGSLEGRTREAAADLDGHAESARNRQGDDDDSETRPRPDPGPGYGWCGVCGTRYRVRDDGLLQDHGPRHHRCKGSRQPPDDAQPPGSTPRAPTAASARTQPGPEPWEPPW